jgi:hypothetical protein
MKKLLLSLALSTLFISVQSQDLKVCVTDEMMNDWFRENPTAKAEFEKRQQEAKEQDAIAFKSGYGQQNKTMAAPIYTIPVVFHVLHIGGAENISDAQIHSAVSILTRDYNKLNADTAVVVPQFKNLIGDVKFEFKLATKDPLGNCTNGIVRHTDVKTDWVRNISDYIYTWPRDKYLNIYVVKTITGGAAGYTYLPGTSPSLASDAIVVLHDYVGSIGTSNVGRSRVLTHEVGHWLNLSHVWGNTNNASVACGDDGVTDTPITRGHLSCPSGTAAAIFCTPGIVENYQNYMDYSYCDVMFTPGQATRMTNAINSSVGQRNNLSTVGNLTFTGIISPLSPCAPIADFHSYNGFVTNLYTVCATQSLTFYDDSYNGTITSRNWSTNSGGTIASPTGTNTAISFPTAGSWTVAITVANATGTSTATKTITVLPNTANYNSTYQESFEATGLPANWTIINQTGGTTWQQYFGAAATGVNSYFIQNAVNPNNAIDIMETPSYDFLSNPGAIFTFKYAYARQNSTWNDVFKVQASSNCGGSWVDIYTPTPATMASGSGGTTTTPFVPTAGQFKTYTLTTHPAFNVFKSQSNVRLRFYFMEDPASGFGNNIFLEDINFNGTLGVNELSKSIEFVLFPNPSTGSATIDFTISDNADIKYNVVDVIGRIVEQEKSLNLSPGHHSFVVNESQTLKAGIYFVSFELNGQKISRKLIIE